MSVDKDIIIFGAGTFGKMALAEYGERVAYFVDNNESLHNSYIDTVKIVSLDYVLGLKKQFHFIIATKSRAVIKQQLQQNGILDYEDYPKENGVFYYPTSQLVINPYKNGGTFIDTSSKGIEQKIAAIDAELESLSNSNVLFNHIEIETINRCNGGCTFCPVSTKNDTRDYAKMSDELFFKIIGELEELKYDGRIALFSNNEPFLDDRIIDFQKYAKEHLPYARFHLFTNGTLLSLEKFKKIIPYLDELVIDNYNQKLELIPNNKKIVEYCEQHNELKEKVTVVLRKIDEVLSTRGGDAPNANNVSYPEAKCVLPFKQLIIRPDGKVSLCCNDPLGKNTLADLNHESLVEAWNNAKFQMVRNCLSKGRKNWKHCEFCDVFNLG